MDAVIARRMHETFERSRETVLRAQQAVDRAARVRETLPDRVSERSSSRQQEVRGQMRQLQLAVKESARSVLDRDRLLATVSHELRQPLNAALAALRVVDLGSGEPTASARAALRRQLFQMARLVEDLLDVSRITLNALDMRLEHVGLRSVIADAMATIEPEAAERQLTLTVAPIDERTCIWGDASRLRQVFSNLLSNAVRYTPEGGRVTISNEIDEGYVFTTITDTGAGISETDLIRIFEPFARAATDAPRGLGIGLAVVHGLVELHGGSTRVSSAGPGLGSSFTVTLPLCPHGVTTRE